MMARRKPAVSLCMIVRDEESNLAECLSPVARLFDEVVIIDTGSHDHTRQIARQFTPRVYDFPWCDDFAAARNESLRRASGDWIFWLDADDRLTAPAAEQLQALLKSLDDRREVFFMNTAILTDSTEDAGVVTHPRLFRRHPRLHWHGRVHEQLGSETSELGYESRFSDVQIEHCGYLDSKLRQRKLRRNLRLLCMDHAVNPDNTSVLLHLGQTHLGLGSTREARKFFLRVADARDTTADPLRLAFAMLAGLALHEGKFAESLAFARQGLALFPDDENFLYSQALAQYECQDFPAAVKSLATIFSGSPPPLLHFGASASIKRKLAPHLLGTILYIQHVYPQAEATFQSVLRDFPDHTASWYSLGLVHIATGDRRQFETAVAALNDCRGGDVQQRLLVARWQLKHGRLDQVGPLIDELIALAPQSACPRTLRAEWLSRCCAPRAAVLQALQDVLRVEPGNAEARRGIVALESHLQPTPTASAASAALFVMPGAPALQSAPALAGMH